MFSTGRGETTVRFLKSLGPRRLKRRWVDTLMPTRVTTLMADWDEVPSAFLERTTKVVVQRAALSGTTP